MKSRRFLFLTVLVSLVTASLTFATNAGAEVKVESEDDKAIYLIGVTFGRQLSRLYLTDHEAEVVAKALLDTHKGEELKLDPQVYGPKLGLLQEVRLKKGLDIELKKSASYLAEQRKSGGAKVTNSGLIYTEMSAGSGPQPEKTAKVKVHYEGRLVDGSIFDSSRLRGQPAEFPLSGVIPCWTEGVGMMKVGGKSKLVCPSEIAYGEKGAPPSIPPGAALTFEVELLAIVE